MANARAYPPRILLWHEIVNGCSAKALAGGDLSGLFQRGGIVGEQHSMRHADAAGFEHAPCYHGGGFAGSGLLRIRSDDYPPG